MYKNITMYFFADTSEYFQDLTVKTFCVQDLAVIFYGRDDATFTSVGGYTPLTWLEPHLHNSKLTYKSSNETK